LVALHPLFATFIFTGRIISVPNGQEKHFSLSLDLLSTIKLFRSGVRNKEKVRVNVLGVRTLMVLVKT
jgi:hypothetical protein